MCPAPHPPFPPSSLQVSGPLLPLYLWGFLFGLSLFLMTLYPVAIAPLFNKYEPLPEVGGGGAGGGGVWR